MSRRNLPAALAVSIAITGSPLTLGDSAPQVPASTQLAAAARNEVLDELARRLETEYAVVKTAAKLAKAIRAKRKSNAYKAIASGPDLARVVTDDLYEIARDKHLRVSYSFEPLPPALPWPPPAPIVEQMRKQNGMIAKVEILDGNVGYMRVNGVPYIDSAREAVAAAFAFLCNTDALIIDNRGNGGGDPNTVALYMSYLSEGEPYVVNRFNWRKDNRVEEFRTTPLGALAYGARKPVFVLTSPATFSGGEELSYDIQAFKRGVLVGETTGGGANPGGPVPLGHQFVVNMPGGQAVNPVTGGSWEGVGVKPDVGVPTEHALSKAHRLAIERLMADANDPIARIGLEAIALKLELSAPPGHGGSMAGESRLANSALLGTYVSRAGAVPPVTVMEREGKLIQQIPGYADAALAHLSGNRYKPTGMPDEFFTSFNVKDGKIRLLIESPGPALLLEKQ